MSETKELVKAISDILGAGSHMFFSVGLMFLSAWVLMLCWGAVGDDLDWPNLTYLNAVLIAFAIRALMWALGYDLYRWAKKYRKDG